MISPPRRSVTRFLVPFIDVLILLFCIFLLLPFVTPPAVPDTDPPKAEAAQADVKELRRELDEARRRLDRTQKDRATVADKTRVRVLEIDPANGKLFYHAPDRRDIHSERDAHVLVDDLKRAAGEKDPLVLILYPRRLSGFPLESQVGEYRRWFAGVPVTFDKPLAGP